MYSKLFQKIHNDFMKNKSNKKLIILDGANATKIYMLSTTKKNLFISTLEKIL